MKKVILGIALVMGVSLSTFAQIGAGKMFAGGGLGISYGTSKGITDGTTTAQPKVFGISINPSAGYFISDNLALGLALSFDRSRSKSEANNVEVKNISSSIGFSPMVRYYKGFNETFFAFVEGSIGFTSGNFKSVVDGTTTKTPMFSNFGVSVAPGFAFFPTEKYAFELKFNLLSFNRNLNKNALANTGFEEFVRSDFELGFNSFAPVSLGFNYFF